MKKLNFILLLVLLVNHMYSQWTNKQLEKAGTGQNVKFLSKIEKETILYVNLARLYPKEFKKNELKNYFGPVENSQYLKDSPDRKSLLATLDTMQAVGALMFDEEIHRSAKCFAKELGESGRADHDRKVCEPTNYWECCSFGMTTGKDVAMQLLIDHSVEGLGHRTICFHRGLTKIGPSEHSHAEHGTCTVVEFLD